MQNVVLLRRISPPILLVCLLAVLPAIAQKPEPAKTPAPLTIPNIMPLSEIKPGMIGIAKTVFQGTKPEDMGVEILGVLNNANGPKSDIILIRLKGTKPEYTGVVAGMSGSPVYIDGKLIGALAFRIGQFSKEPIAGVTPIEEMLEINELDRSTPPQTSYSFPADKDSGKSGSNNGSTPSKSQTSAADEGSQLPPLQSLQRTMTPIAAPLAFNGFTDEAIKMFAPQMAAAGIMPVVGMGSASDIHQPEPMEPGSSVGIVLVRGDMDISATCTVTYIDPERLLACGHPIYQFGKVDMPMTKSTVIATLPSSFSAFKIAETTDTIGAFKQDRHTGIMGRVGGESHMVPVSLTLRGGSKPKTFNYEMMNSPRLTPLITMVTVFNALQALNEHGDDATYRMTGKIDVKGFPSVQMQNMFAPGDNQSTSVMIALSVGDRFTRIYDNTYQEPEITNITLDFDVIRERRWARLESARTDATEARPGEQVMVEVVLRPYRGENIVRQIPVRIPTSTPKGNLRILISDGDTLDRTRRVSMFSARKIDLATTIAGLNKERTNTRLYVSLLEANPQAMIGDKVMPTLPLSVMNVMDGLRGTQDMVVMNESAVNESSTPLDFVVSGSQVISIRIK